MGTALAASGTLTLWIDDHRRRVDTVHVAVVLHLRTQPQHVLLEGPEETHRVTRFRSAPHARVLRCVSRVRTRHDVFQARRAVTVLYKQSVKHNATDALQRAIRNKPQHIANYSTTYMYATMYVSDIGTEVLMYKSKLQPYIVYVKICHTS